MDIHRQRSTERHSQITGLRGDRVKWDPQAQPNIPIQLFKPALHFPTSVVGALIPCSVRGSSLVDSMR